jgi:hypothetical protein
MLTFDKNEQLICWTEVETDGLIVDVVVLPGAEGEEEDARREEILNHGAHAKPPLRVGFEGPISWSATIHDTNDRYLEACIHKRLYAHDSV